MVECPHMGTLIEAHHESDLLSALVQAKTLWEFDRVLQRDLVARLGCDLIAFYFYSPTTGIFTPVSEALCSPDSPAFAMASSLPKGRSRRRQSAPNPPC